MKQNRPNSDTTPRRWSVPQKLNVVSFKLETTQGCNDNSVNESAENAPTLDEQIEENKSHKFINYLEEYCGEILKTRRDNFVDLKGFKEQEFAVTIEDVEEAKRNAEKITKIVDQTGFSNVHLNEAGKAGIYAFAESQVLTRRQVRSLKDKFNVDASEILYDGVPETSMSKFAKRIRNDRDSRIIETYVDFKSALKTKHDVLRRVETIEKLDKLHELPEIKKLRNRGQENVDVEGKVTRQKMANNFKTPPSVLKRKYNPLDYNNIMDDFLDDQARGFVEENQLLAKRRKSVAPTQSF